MTTVEAIAAAFRTLTGSMSPLPLEAAVRDTIAACVTRDHTLTPMPPHHAAARLRRWSQILAEAARRLEETEP